MIFNLCGCADFTFSSGKNAVSQKVLMESSLMVTRESPTGMIVRDCRDCVLNDEVLVVSQ